MAKVYAGVTQWPGVKLSPDQIDVGEKRLPLSIAERVDVKFASQGVRAHRREPFARPIGFGARSGHVKKLSELM